MHDDYYNDYTGQNIHTDQYGEYGEYGEYGYADEEQDYFEREQGEQDTIILKHLGIQATTSDAIFFTTYVSIHGSVSGAWIPKNAIIEMDHDSVVVKGWCRITKIGWS